MGILCWGADSGNDRILLYGQLLLMSDKTRVNHSTRFSRRLCGCHSFLSFFEGFVFFFFFPIFSPVLIFFNGRGRGRDQEIGGEGMWDGLKGSPGSFRSEQRRVLVAMNSTMLVVAGGAQGDPSDPLGHRNPGGKVWGPSRAETSVGRFLLRLVLKRSFDSATGLQFEMVC